MIAEGSLPSPTACCCWAVWEVTPQAVRHTCVFSLFYYAPTNRVDERIADDY
jgi:hypothetical protein